MTESGAGGRAGAAGHRRSGRVNHHAATASTSTPQLTPPCPDRASSSLTTMSARIGNQDSNHRPEIRPDPVRKGVSAERPVNCAIRAPLGLVRTSAPTRTVGTVSLPPFAARTCVRAWSSCQILRHVASIPRRAKSLRSDEQYGHPGRQKTSTVTAAGFSERLTYREPGQAAPSFPAAED
jgi:hypothetical protein